MKSTNSFGEQLKRGLAAILLDQAGIVKHGIVVASSGN
jgi:hypothetical protein